MLVYCRSVLKGPPSDDARLSLVAKHYLSICPDSSDQNIIASEATRLKITTLHNVLDVALASSSLKVNINARYINQAVPESYLARSALVRELSRFTRRHAAEIGLEACSDPDWTHGVVSCTYTNFRLLIITPGSHYFKNLVALTPSNIQENNHTLLRSGCPPIYLSLIDIEIVAAKGLNNSQSSTRLKFGGVYAEEVDLAFLASWMQLLEKFFALQIVKRYPLIFGRWREVKQQQSDFFPGIARSIARITERSGNRDFKAKTQHTIQSVINRQHRRADMAWTSVGSLKRHRGVEPAVSLDRLQERRRSLAPSPAGFQGDYNKGGTQQQIVDTLCYAFGALYDETLAPRRKIKFLPVGSASKDTEQAQLDDEDHISRASAVSDIRSDSMSDDEFGLSLCVPVGIIPPRAPRNIRLHATVTSLSNGSLDIQSILDLEQGNEAELPEYSDSGTDSELGSVFSQDLDGHILIAEPTSSHHHHGGNKDPDITQWLHDLTRQDSPMHEFGNLPASSSGRVPVPNKSDGELPHVYIGQVDPICGEDALMDDMEQTTDVSDLSFDFECESSIKSFGSQGREDAIILMTVPGEDLGADLDSDVGDKMSPSVVTSSMSWTSC